MRLLNASALCAPAERERFASNLLSTRPAIILYKPRHVQNDRSKLHDAEDLTFPHPTSHNRERTILRLAHCQRRRYKADGDKIYVLSLFPLSGTPSVTGRYFKRKKLAESTFAPIKVEFTSRSISTRHLVYFQSVGVRSKCKKKEKNEGLCEKSEIIRDIVIISCPFSPSLY